MAGSGHYPLEVRIKGSLAKGLLIALAISLIPATAISAQKITSGSKCKVQKQKVVQKNKTYTCIKSGKKLVWNKGVRVIVKPTPTPSATPTPTSTPAPKIESITYSPPSQPSANIQTCEIKEKNINRDNPPPSLLPTGFPRHTIAQKTGTVKWALIPLDFSDLPGEANFRSRID